MKKSAIVILAALAVAGVAFFLKSKSDSEPDSLDAKIEKILSNPNPTQQELDALIDLVEESSKRNGNSEPVVTADPRTVLGKAIAGPANASRDRDYDLPALEARFVGALQISDTGERRSALREVASFLAEKADPETAKRFMEGILSTRDHHTDGDGYAFATAFADDLSKKDAAVAAKWSELLPERLRYPTYQLVAKNWTAQDPRALDEWTQKITDPGLRATVIRMTSHALAASDPAGFAKDWAVRLAHHGQDGGRLSDIVTMHWGATDFDAAYAWASSLKDETDRKSAVLALNSAKAKNDPPAAAAWASQTLEGDLRTQAIQGAIIPWVAKDPAAAAAWVDKLGEPKISDATFDTIAISWMKKDDVKAESWIAAAPVNEQRKEYVSILGRN